MATASGVGVWMARGVYRHTWTLTGTVTVGKPATLAGLPDKTVSVRGTFGAGGSVTLFGSTASGTGAALATTAAFALNDNRGEGNVMTFTANDGRQINENPHLIFPKLTVASGATALTVEITAQSPKR